MSLPHYTRQLPIFGVQNLLADQFEPQDRFRIFREKVFPLLEAARPAMQEMYELDNGRPGTEPVLLLGISILQFLERQSDRAAMESLALNLGWKLALNQELAVQKLDPSLLTYFRRRLLEHENSKLAFDTILQGLVEAGLVSRRGVRRLDSTHVLGLLAQLSRLEKLRETIRLAMLELREVPGVELPQFWERLWELYVQSKPEWQVDKSEAQQRCQAVGGDMLLLVEWVKAQAQEVVEGKQARLLVRVFEENFEVQQQQQVALKAAEAGTVLNPHEPEAQVGRKRNKAWSGYKVQVGESVDEKPREQGEPKEQFITSMVTTSASENDQRALARVRQEEKASGLDTPHQLHVDSGYVSGSNIRESAESGTELVGPVAEHGDCGKGFKSDRFVVDIAKQVAVCPAGQSSVRMSVVEHKQREQTGCRFAWDTPTCRACPLYQQCTGRKPDEKGAYGRTLEVGEDHDYVQHRRAEQQTEEYHKRMERRNAIEGTQSELVRGHGLRRARYRGEAKVRLANYFIGAACNVKRWIKRAAWEARQAAQTALAVVRAVGATEAAME